MKGAYDPKAKINLKEKRCGFGEYDNPITSTKETVFNIGQSYSNEPNETLKCKICGSKKFYVGAGSCHTAIKCPVCEYEICIHDG